MKRIFRINPKHNIIIVSALLFIIYFLYIIISYAGKSKIFAYQVKEGSLAENNIYTGLILRDESIYNSEGVGYVNYFAREGEHVGVGDLIYTIDESGAIDSLISDNLGENSLTNDDLNELRVEASNFTGSFNKNNFRKTYDFLYTMDGLVLKLANMNILDKLNSANSKALSDVVMMCRAEKPGYVVYNTDGFESISANSLNKDLYDKTKYEKNLLVSSTLVGKDAPAYKLINSEDWSVAIQLPKNKAKELMETEYVKVKFLENQLEMNAKLTITQVGDEYFGLLSFNSCVLTFCKERFVDIELEGSDSNGLKIPASSIVHKEFFLIPKDYAIEEGEENTYYFLRKAFLEDGTITAELMPVEVYAETEDSYYVDDSVLRIGDYLLKQDSSSEFPVSTKGELVGVYNINKGYADFRQISILYQNDEYAIVKPNTAYGLNVYDYIVLDSTSVKDEEIIYD